MTDQSALIRIRGVHKFFGDLHVLRGIDLDIANGEVCVIMGPSGSGKSTLLRCLNQLETISAGEIFIDGELLGYRKDPSTGVLHDLTDKQIASQRSQIGMVFQQPNPFPMSIYENVVYGLRINGVKDKQVLDEAVEKALQRASIWDEVKDRLHDSAIGLSGGQQQRVCVARVLATSPKIILLDEPTSALDPISAGKIEETLYGLKNKYTMLLVTRSMQQASRISDKTGFFLDGDLIEFNDTKKMFLNPQHKETEDYISGKFG